MSSCYLMTQAIGNLIIVFISALSFQKQVNNYNYYFFNLLISSALNIVKKLMFLGARVSIFLRPHAGRHVITGLFEFQLQIQKFQTKFR